MIFRRFLDVYECSDSLCLEGVWTYFGAILGWFVEGLWAYINARTHCKVLASSFWGRLCEISLCCCHPLGYDVGVVLYVVYNVVHTFTDVLISHFEVIAFMCDEMVRALFWSVVIGLVCWLVVWSALLDLVCLVWFGLALTICADWFALVSSVWSFLSVLVWRGPYCPGLVVLIYPGQVWSRCSVLLC